MEIKNQRILITGGAGYLGKHLIERYYANNDITIYSRDEAKHYYIKKHYPNINCVIGDISDREMLVKAGKGHTIGIFAASLKQIGAVDQNYEIANRIIVNGAFNSRICAEENNFHSACFVSSDKSRSATTLYGAMKFVAGESFIINGEESNVNLSTAIYGNVTNSTGSIIPLMWDAIKNNYQLELYSEDMTRFMLDISEAVNVIDFSLCHTGYNIIPKINSFKIKDLFEIFSEKFGLKYKITSPRISEKIHEIMISSEELSRTKLSPDGKYYLMHYKNVYNELELPYNEYSSRDFVLNKKELDEALSNYNYYKPF